VPRGRHDVDGRVKTVAVVLAELRAPYVTATTDPSECGAHDGCHVFTHGTRTTTDTEGDPPPAT